MKRRLQDISSEKVIAELAGTSFMTETGKVIEGNYQVGDIAPVVFDRSSKRYLAAWKTHRDEPVKAQPLRDEAPPTSLITINKIVLAKFIKSEWNIYFTVLGEDPLTSTKHYYVDLADVVMEFYNAGLNLYNIIPFALRILEDRPDLGALFAFYGAPENFTSGMVIKFKVGSPVSPAVPLSYGGCVYYQRELEYRIVDFGTLDEDLVDVLPDFDIRLGHPAALGENNLNFFPPEYYFYGTRIITPTDWFQPMICMYEPYTPMTLRETSPYSWHGEATVPIQLGYNNPPKTLADFVPESDSTVSFITDTVATVTITKLNQIGKLRDFSNQGWGGVYAQPYGRELIPIGAMIWCADDNINNLKWEIQFSAREEYVVSVSTISTSEYVPQTFEASHGSVPLPSPFISTAAVEPYHVHIPLLLKRDETRWTVEDYQDILGKTLCLETRGKYVDIFGAAYTKPRAILFRLDSPGQTQERVYNSNIHPDQHEFDTTTIERWFSPNHVSGRYRKAWGIPSGGTKTKPKLMVDFTSVDYSLWRQIWSWDPGFTNALIDQFLVRTFFLVDTTIIELPNAATSEDQWSYRVGLVGWWPDIFIDCIDYHSIPPVTLNPYLSPGVYYVPPYNFIPGDLTAKPARMPYKHVGGGSIGGSLNRLIMCRTCPVKSQTANRSVYILGAQVYDYDQIIPKIAQQDRHSRHLLTWFFPPGQLPSVDSTIDLEGDAVITLKHLTDYTKNISANEVSFLQGGAEVCDVAAEVKVIH